MLEPFGVKTGAVGGDLSITADIERLIRSVLDAHGGVDILYNNAGIQGERRPAWDAPLDEWKAVFQVNVFAMALLCTAFAQGMRERGYGRIVNLSSGIKDAPDLAPYSTSKAAVIKLTQELAFGLRGTGVLVNHLDPGWLKTDMAGPDAEFEVETVLPGAIVPALLGDDGPTGTGFRAQEYRGKRV
jgi:NAD(P)-dependent dehydrogenase (short-subunit alcohol dehydrogenase family)